MKKNRFTKQRYELNIAWFVLIMSFVIVDIIFVIMFDRLIKNNGLIGYIFVLCLINVIFAVVLIYIIYKNIKIYRIKKQGLKLNTTFKEIRSKYSHIQGEMGGINNYYIVSYIEIDKKLYVFESKALKFNPYSELVVFCKYIPVYVYKDDYRKYYVDIREIEQKIK